MEKQARINKKTHAKYEEPKTKKQQQQQQRPLHKPILLKDFNIEQFDSGEFMTDNDKIKSTTHDISFPKYNGKPFVFQVPFFKLTSYGFPPVSTPDKKLTFQVPPDARYGMKLPLDSEQESCVILRGMYEQIDRFMRDNMHLIIPESKRRQKKKKVNYIYKPIIRPPGGNNGGNDDDSDSETEHSKPTQSAKKEYPKYDFWRAKLDTEYDPDPNNVKPIKTMIYKKDSKTSPEKERINPEKPEDLLEFIRWGSELRLIVMLSKMWADKNAKITPGSGDLYREYGLSFKILGIEVVPNKGGSSNIYELVAFQDDEDSNYQNQDDAVVLARSTNDHEQYQDNQNNDQNDFVDGDSSEADAQSDDADPDHIDEEPVEDESDDSEEYQAPAPSKKKHDKKKSKRH